MDIIKDKSNQSVPQVVNGWNFQVAAAMYIFLCNIKHIKEVGLEKTEDIEIVLNSGKKIFAQAKSSLEPDSIEIKTHYSEVYDSLRALEGRKNSEIQQLIMIFNFYKPFGKDVYFDPGSYDKKQYNNLPTKVQNKLSKHITDKKYKLDLDKLSFWLLKFDKDNPHNKVLEFMQRKFNDLTSANWEEVLKDWHYQLYMNGADVKRFIDKDILAGSVMRAYISKSISEELLVKLDIECMPGDYEAIYLPKYNKHFNSVTARFMVSNSIYNIYCEYIKIHGKSDPNLLYNFAKSEYNNCGNEIKSLLTDEIKYQDNLTKLFLYNIGFRYTCIEQVKEVMGL